VPDHSLADEILVDSYVSSYVARRIATPVWTAISPSVKAAVVASARSLEVAKTMCSHVAAFAGWVHSEGLTVSMAVLADEDVIDRYIQAGMTDLPEGTRATRRAILRRVARRIAVDHRPCPEAIRYRNVRPPYEPWQVARYLELAASQPTRRRCSIALGVLALGLGAGLDGRDMAWVRGSDVSTGPHGATVVSIAGGTRPRTVVVLDRYAPILADCAEMAADALVVGGSTVGHRNTTSVALSRLIADPSLPTLVPSRLRSTWLLTQLNLGTPLTVLLESAGLTTARPLEDLLSFTAPVPEERAVGLLRGVG
jgi:hypothetical protein